MTDDASFDAETDDASDDRDRDHRPADGADREPGTRTTSDARGDDAEARGGDHHGESGADDGDGESDDYDYFGEEGTDGEGGNDGESDTSSEDSENREDAVADENGPDGEDRPSREDTTGEDDGTDESTIPADVRRYERFTKIEGATYERANGFLRDRTYITAREWAIARLCTDFRTETGVEMTKIGKNLPRLVPFMTDTYTPQAVNQARASFANKVRKAGATFLYGAMSDFFTAEELDDVMYEATEVAKFLLEVEGADLAVEAELAAEDRIQSVMREVHRQSVALRHDAVECPHCGHEFEPDTNTTDQDRPN